MRYDVFRSSGMIGAAVDDALVCLSASAKLASSPLVMLRNIRLFCSLPSGIPAKMRSVETVP